ncbi:IDEAL domain-containing protein [Priestia endophytica]|uniref:Phosphoesterase n=2 Tax=Priestia endophytica TaxID=135735 RepID=A0AAX1QA81_9BACI|nr:IDEAL domain-containing protein [Priestia endophytica]KAB2489497.1 IDEAL domain-containing protein [Priestia endophytica]KYG33079.1 phosphoesterase [Priestia endophytica]MBG9813316.1 phosphoesterase [Priestia endophytica]RAS76715.1 phosphoesterase [Priestia endophytica]RAS82508.1 phosphoesterase [Priestia endophytica]
MENNVSNEMNQVEINIHDEVVAELFLNQVVKDFKKGKILEEIDQSLKNRDKETFLRLTEELQSVS